jgi:hypothetical protein
VHKLTSHSRTLRFCIVVVSMAASLAAYAGPVESTSYATDDLPETGLQGQVPIADQKSGRSSQGYRRGLTLVGRNTLRDRGGNLQMAAYGHCAYVGTGGVKATHELEGIAVIDVRQPSDPKLVRIVSSPSGYSSWEGLEASSNTGILISFITSRTSPLPALPQSWEHGLTAAFADGFEVYTVKRDCENPTRVATVSTRDVLPGGLHGLKLSPDGKTAYITSLQAGGRADDPNQTTLVAYDLAVPDYPRLLARWKWSDDPRETVDFGLHDGTISPDGSVLFLGSAPMLSRRKPLDPTKLMIQAFDVHAIQNRKDNAGFRLLGAVHWNDCDPSLAHGAQYAVVAGKPYIIAGGECTGVQLHVIDVTDPSNMKVVSTYTTEATDLRNSEKVAADEAFYPAHYFGVDNVSDATTLFVTWYASGLRALDIRDPGHLREFAYFNPPAHPNDVICTYSCTSAYELSTSDVIYDPKTGNIWFAGSNGGFYVVHVTSSAGSNGLRQPKRN